MKTSSIGNWGSDMKNVICPVTRFFVLTATALVSLSTLANAQFFYAAQGVSGKIGKVTATGVPLPASLTPWVEYVGQNVQGITTDSFGNVFAAVGSTIYQITPSGSSSLYGTYTDPISGLTMNSSNVLYGVKDSGGPFGGGDIGIYSAGGTFTPINLTNPAFATFFSANGLKFDGLGNIFVTNSSNGGIFPFSLLKLTPSGPNWTVSQFVNYGGSFSPYDVVMDLSNNVYVSSASASPSILKYDSTGAPVVAFTLSGIPGGQVAGLAFANNKLYATSAGTFKIWEIDPTTGAATDFLGAGVFLPDFRSTFLAYSPVPEPSQICLVLLSGLALIGRRVMRNKSQVLS